jgi:hypothetical protein
VESANSLGNVKLENGTVVTVGRMLVKYQWNAALYDPLQANRDVSQSSTMYDTRFHKNRLFGFWDESTVSTFL